ncbi:MAG: phage baseplate assembly protein V [Paracoccaceae bacterium]
MTRGIGRILAKHAREIADLQRRMASVTRSGRVVEVDPDTGRVRVDVGAEGAPLITPWVRWPERAGARKTWNPPSPGELMTVVSPGGEVGEGSLALHGGFTDDNPPPSSDGDSTVFTLGPVTATVAAGGVVLSVGGVSLTLAAAGLDLAGGELTHDGTDVGKTHTHDHQPGPGTTQPPN